MARNTCPACSCGPVNFLWMLISAIITAVGIYTFVMTLQAQWAGTMQFLNVALWYALAVLVIGFGKMAKWKASEGCAAHCKK